MKELAIDIETYSSYDLTTCGVYRYVESPDFAVLLFAYCIDGGQVECVDLASGEPLPLDVMKALTDASVTKTAHNAMFERICLSRMLFGSYRFLDPSQWECTMVRAARMGLPLSLAQCAEVLRLKEGKMREGKALIRYFSCPDKEGRRRLPSDAPDKWAVFKKYCKRDVEVEQGISEKVRRLGITPIEKLLYVADQKINDRGVMIDRVLVDNAVRIDGEYKAELMRQARELTGLENPNSPQQIKDWIHRETNLPVSSLAKNTIDELADRLKFYPQVGKLIKIRKELAKTSNKKYEAMLNCVCADGRIHGLMQFHGAARTGRWAGRLVQVQNLPQNHIADIDVARELVRAGDLDELELNYSSVSQTLSELIRTAFVASDGHTFHVCDFSAIEARVIAWLAGEDWVLEVFRKGGNIYCANASKMFGVPVEKHGQNAELYPKGKIATLALGYGGGVPALEAMGGARLGLTADEMKDIVRLWRNSNTHIVKAWAVIEQAAITAVKTGNSVVVYKGIEIGYRWGCLTIKLPSGRVMVYPRAKVETEYGDSWRGDHETIVYEGVKQATKKWESMRTYGGKLVENIVQAIARDILGVVLLRAEERGMRVVFHVHDEIVVEAPEGRNLSDIETIFSEPIEWCRDLPLKGAGYETKYYLKD